MKIVIQEYDHQWPFLFENEKMILSETLHPATHRVEHIGSTAVPGLPSKPVIDILIGLRDFSVSDLHISGICLVGYTYVPKYESIFPQRRYFSKKRDGESLYHLHMVELESEFWSDHLAFRDILRGNNGLRDAYAELKTALAAREWKTREEYTQAKSGFIRDVLLRNRG